MPSTKRANQIFALNQIFAKYPGLSHASCAMAFFRHRNHRFPRFANPSPLHDGWTIQHKALYRRQARRYIALARSQGFRGSPTQIILREQSL